RPEVIIDVELLEVDRTRLLEYGLQIASSGPAFTTGAGISSSVGVDQGANSIITLQKLRNLSQADVLFANLPTLYFRLLKTDAHSRTLANPQLRTSDGSPAKAAFGEQVPVPQTIFTPL